MTENPMPNGATKLFGPSFAAPGVGFCAVVVLAVGSCAPARPAAGLPSAAPDAANARGTILAMRPILPGAGAEVLRQLASAAAASEPGSGQNDARTMDFAPMDLPTLDVPTLDFIIRQAGGGTIAVAQTNEPGFQVGDQVTIRRGARTRLTRPGA